jgi:hypothetical protein
MQDPFTLNRGGITASIPREHALRDDPHMNQYPTFTVRRKVAKRTFPWDLPGEEIQLALPRPQDDDDDGYIRETNRRRIEEPVFTLADDAPTENTVHDITVALPPLDATVATTTTTTTTTTTAAVTESDPVTDTHPNVSTTRVPRFWAPVEDAQLTRAVRNTPQKKHKGKVTSDWIAISAQVQGRTSKHCHNRWRHTLDPSVDRSNGSSGAWEEEEDIVLKNAVRKHDGKDWDAIAALVPGRSQRQCHIRWRYTLDPSIYQANGRTGKWKEEEDIVLKNAVQVHGGKNWFAIAVLVPGRTRYQCHNRWHKVLDPSVDRSNGSSGAWEEEEDIVLKNAVRKHDGKDWAAISALVPGRTSKQCQNRCRNTLNLCIKQANRRTGKWKEDEDTELKNAVRKHGGKDWAAIAALVSGRTRIQCHNRWRNTLDPSIVQAKGRTGKWKEDEDIVLRDAVQVHGGKNWIAIAALVPGRTIKQCSNRWHEVLDPSIDPGEGLSSTWTAVEDCKLKAAVDTYRGKHWGAIAALMPGRTTKQCQNRWHHVLVSR